MTTVSGTVGFTVVFVSGIYGDFDAGLYLSCESLWFGWIVATLKAQVIRTKAIEDRAYDKHEYQDKRRGPQVVNPTDERPESRSGGGRRLKARILA